MQATNLILLPQADKTKPLSHILTNQLNKSTGEIVSPSMFSDDFNKRTVASYFSLLKREGFLEHIDRGKYKVLKTIDKVPYTDVSVYRNTTILSDSEKRVKKLLDEMGLVLVKNKKVSSDVINELTNKLGIERKSVISKIHALRKKTAGVNTKADRVHKSSVTDFYKICHKYDITRKSPNKERDACNKIIKVINDLPKGGAGMLIGTPTSFCISKNTKNKLLLTDNMEVATTMIHSTNVPTSIVVGNAINPTRAKVKATHWKSNNSTYKCSVLLDIVDQVSYTYYVTQLAETNPLAKVILMTSGLWGFCKESQEKYEGFNFDFKTPSEYLTSKYSNLHIVAMVGGAPTESFKIHYLNNGNTTVY